MAQREGSTARLAGPAGRGGGLAGAGLVGLLLLGACSTAPGTTVFSPDGVGRLQPARDGGAYYFAPDGDVIYIRPPRR